MFLKNLMQAFTVISIKRFFLHFPIYWVFMGSLAMSDVRWQAVWAIVIL